MNEKGRMPTWGQMVEQLRKQRYWPSVYLFPHRLIFVIRQQTTPRAYLWRNNTERERDDIWKKTAADKVNWRDRGAAEASTVFSSALGHICAGRADICGGATNIWEMSMPAAEGGYLDVWKQKNYLCQSLRRDVNCLSLFSQCGFMWIYSWKTTHSWKTSYLIWLEVLHAHVLQRLSKIE